MKICPAIVFLVVPDTATSIVMLVVSSSLVDIMYYLMFMGRATVLFSILLSSLCILFWGVSRFTGFPSNPCFLRQNPMLPWFLRQVPCVVCNWGGGGVHWVAWRRLWNRIFFKAGVHFNLPTRFLIPDPSLDTVPAGDWGAELRGLYVNRTLQRRSRFENLPIPVLAKVVITFSLP